jgi:hypothetical protein
VEDVSVYAVVPQGIYLYAKEGHNLYGVVEADYRAIVADSQPTVAGAPITLLIVSDTSNLILLTTI